MPPLLGTAETPLPKKEKKHRQQHHLIDFNQNMKKDVLWVIPFTVILLLF